MRLSAPSGRVERSRAPANSCDAAIPASASLRLNLKNSPVLSGGKAGPHKIQGIGAGFVPGTLDTSVYHEVMQVGNEEAAAMTRLVLKTDGVFVGISSGSALEAAVRLARKPPYDHGRIVVIFPRLGRALSLNWAFQRITSFKINEKGLIAAN